MKRLAASSLALLLSSCLGAGDGIFYFRIALDDSGTAASKLAGACFNSGMAPSGGAETTETGGISQEVLIVWDGVVEEGKLKQYLQLPGRSFTLGNTPTIAFSSDLLVGTDKVFTITRVTRTPNMALMRTTVATTTVTVRMDPGASSGTGTILLSSKSECEGTCGGVATPSCEVTMNFVFRRFTPQLFESPVSSSYR